jgi:hypothetical protein
MSNLTTRSSGPWAIVGRVWPRHSGGGRPLNSVVRRLERNVAAKIHRLPQMQKRRRRIDLGKGIVRCHVSHRWLQFPSDARQFSEGALMTVDVMTDPEFGKPRKLCEVVLSHEDLMHILQRMPIKAPRE